MAYKTRLKIGQDTWDVLSVNFGFSRQVDIKGKLASIISGGDVSLTVESAEDAKLMHKMVAVPAKAEEMVIEYDNGTAEGEMKKLTLTDAYVVGYSENISAYGGNSGTINLSLSARKFKMKTAEHVNDWPGGKA